MARRATVIKGERNKSEHTLVLDAGDSLLYDRDPAGITRGQSSIEVMNLMGYDAMALGLSDITKLSLDELRQRIDEADFAILSANAYVENTRELVAKPYVVIEMGEHRVGILGLTNAGAANGVSVTDPEEAVQEWLPEVQSLADIVILLSHAGPDVDKEIAQGIEGIDVVVSGGSMITTEPFVAEGTDTLVLHADNPLPGNTGQRVGVAYLAFDKGGHLITHNWARIILASAYSDDPEVAAWVEDATKSQ